MRLNLISLASGLLCLLLASESQTWSQQIGVPAHPATIAQVREFTQLTKTDEIYRVGWMAALEMNRSKGAPYWPESFWVDLREEMRTTDLVPTISRIYQLYVSEETMKEVYLSLHKQSVAEFASTPLGTNFCKLQKMMDKDGQAATLGLTQQVFVRVYSRHEAEIKAARTKYVAEHPGWIEPNQ